MNQKRKILLICIAVVVIVSSCTTFSMSGITFQEEKENYTELGDFKKSVWVNEFLGTSGGANLFNITSSAMDDVIDRTIRKEIAKLNGDAAVNVTVKYKASIFNLFLNSITGSIYAPGTVVITGTVVKYN